MSIAVGPLVAETVATAVLQLSMMSGEFFLKRETGIHEPTGACVLHRAARTVKTEMDVAGEGDNRH